jgi:UTP-glucose-1-phosphate uridylyltransferase/mevalonate kinase
MDRGELLKEAQKGGYFSYAAGVAYQVLTHYRVNGLEIDNTVTDLPIKKGLSSSAAICVLVARAFNRIYNLKMTVRGEMEFAYMGEITTPSRCGRMDQGCAYGNKPILMTFDGDWIDVRELKLSRNLYFVLVDLCAGKDTKEILAKLNQGYPFAENDLQRAVQNYLGPINASITNKAVEMIEAGNAEEIGKLMKKAQEEFDKNCIPICPSQLTAPVLHKVLNYEPIQPFILGGKGVGSQGDGAAQFIVKDEECQNKVIEIMEKKLKLPCLKLTLETGRKVRKALIPAAGFGTRLFPASKAIKKELFPVIGKDGKIKPAILTIVEEAISAGIEEIGIIIQPADKAIFEEFFFMPPTIENFNKLSKENQAYSEYLLDVGHRITLIEQKTQDGFGHAVYCSKEWIGNEPFLLMLGDHVYASDGEKSCARQIMDVFERRGQSVVGLRETPEDEVRHYGCATGIRNIEGDEITITEFYEKPDAEYARKHLHVKGMKNDIYLTVFGQYILTPKIFEYLEENVLHNNRERGEFQMTSCLDKLRQEEGFAGYIVKGRRFDIGMPESYRQTIIDFRNA